MEILIMLGFAMMGGLFVIAWILSDIKIEQKYNNTLLEQQNELLKKL